MVLKTYDAENLSEKETITKISSISWNKKFYDTGSFEIHTTSKAFSTGDIVAYKYNGIINSGIVMKIVEKTDDISITGYDLKGILNFRYITALCEYQELHAETIIKNLANDYLLSGERKISGLSVLEDKLRGAITNFSAEKKYLSEALNSFCTENEIGISIGFNLERLSFDIVIGNDISDTVVFGRQFRNIESVEYTKDLFNTYNVCYTVEDENTERIIGTQTGICRRECFQDKNADEYLAQHTEIETLRADATEKYTYGQDYCLGDYVGIVHDGFKTVKQITEIKEVHDKNMHKIIPIFGTQKENPLKKIMRGE